ncbi:TRAP transporter small permease [Peribacillus saganii]|uniref:TRAP transporter small permease n=1 Tax=Peribacillus saganii TaxID=2303992 RepID=A0A372LQW4_9BACI|nr:TRAP transporter small permease [Peribacillus saganii]RFU70121.1 TRAP transporter small permease [Peribacillus saganii]
MGLYVRFADKVNFFIRYLLAALLMLMSGLIIFQVIIRFSARYIDLTLPRWTEEIARYSMVWLVLLGAALAVRYSALIGMEAIAERLSPNAQRVLRGITIVISMVFYVILTVYGFEMLSHVSAQLSPGAKISMAIPYAALPVGGILMLMNSIAVLIETLKGDLNREFFKGSE